MTGGLQESTALHVSNLLRAARHAVIFTGAGISTPSGIPDFRSASTGLWRKSNPMDVASLSAFRYHPDRFYNWLQPLVKTAWQAMPNAAHHALAEMEKMGIIKAVITQNIDSLHHRAGSKNVLELHGSMRTLSCLHCKSTHAIDKFIEALLDHAETPHCPKCNHLLKPDIVLFEEMLPAEAWSKAEWHCQQADLIFVIGSSLEVSPANTLPYYAVLNNVSLIINNLTATHLDNHAVVLLPHDVIETIPMILDKLCLQPTSI
jgi:NAD-dependent deacetylase